MNAQRRVEADEPHHTRLTWDDALIFEWADVELEDLPDLEEVLPIDLISRIHARGEEMEGAYGELYLEDPPAVASELAARLESEYRGFRREIRGLGFELDREADRWPFDVPLSNRFCGTAPGTPELTPAGSPAEAAPRPAGGPSR